MNAQVLKFPSVSENPTQKVMLGFFRQAVTKIAALKIVNIRVEPCCMFGPDGYNFSITVYDVDHDNVTFDFYDFYSKQAIADNLEKAIKAIKTGDFQEIKHVCRSPKNAI